MTTEVLERYDSNNGETAEIEQLPDSSIRVSIYGYRFETILSLTVDSVQSARDIVASTIPKPYTKTI